MRKVFATILFFVVVGFVGYFMSIGENVPTDSVTNVIAEDLEFENPEQIIEEIRDDYPKITQLHWGHMPITYKIDDNCIPRLTSLSKAGFAAIENETDLLVDFEEVAENPDISVHCKSSNVDISTGEGSIADALYELSDDNANIIISGDINIYGQGMACSTGYPTTEVHELLHLFDFVHSPKPNSIMRTYAQQSTQRCKTNNIDKEYISCLKYIYSNGIFPNTCSDIDTEIVISNIKEVGCPDGWYPAGENWCCPEPNMIINDNGNCDY